MSFRGPEPGPVRRRGMGRAACLVAVLATLASLGGLALSARAQNPDDQVAHLTDEFIEHWLNRRPHVATRLGLHDYDPLLVPVTEASLDDERDWMRDFRERLGELQRDDLSFERALDYDLLAARADRELLDLE